MKRFKNYCMWPLIIAMLAALLPDPKVVTPPKQFLKLWFKTPNKGLTKLYWNSTGRFTEYETEKSTIYAQDKFISQKYLLPDHYSGLLFCPFEDGAGSFFLKDITIVDINDKMVRKIDIKQVKPLEQIETFSIKNGVIQAVTSQDAEEAMLSIDDVYSFPYPPWWEKYAINIKTFLISFAIVVILGFLADFSDKAREEEVLDC